MTVGIKYEQRTMDMLPLDEQGTIDIIPLLVFYKCPQL